MSPMQLIEEPNREPVDDDPISSSGCLKNAPYNIYIKQNYSFGNKELLEKEKTVSF